MTAALARFPGFVQTLKHCFPGLAKTKFQGFPGLKNLVFKDFPGYTADSKKRNGC